MKPLTFILEAGVEVACPVATISVPVGEARGVKARGVARAAPVGVEAYHKAKVVIAPLIAHPWKLVGHIPSPNPRPAQLAALPAIVGPEQKAKEGQVKLRVTPKTVAD
jgi:hypothetical protein